jgi:O-methyltransferase involved in polyketide biosynthesis
MAKKNERIKQDAKQGDLSVTALYTAETWHWGGLPNAEIFSTQESRIVFRVTNWVLCLAKVFMWGLKSLRISLLHRHAIIDHLALDQNPDVVVELAAGLSRRGVTVSADSSIYYVEIDLPPVMAKKEALLLENPVGVEALGRGNWQRVASDVRQVHIGRYIGDARRAVCIAEGLFMYLTAEEQRAVWKQVAEGLGQSGSGLFLFDLVPKDEQPKPGLVGRLLEVAMKLFTKGRSFETDSRGREAIRTELLAAGFESVDLYEPSMVAEAWRLPYANKASQQLIFACNTPSQTGEFT